MLLGSKVVPHAGKDQLSEVTLDSPVHVPDEYTSAIVKYVVAVSVSQDCPGGLYQANRNPEVCL